MKIESTPGRFPDHETERKEPERESVGDAVATTGCGIFLLLLGIAVVGGGLYLVIRFVRWAWDTPLSG